MSKPDGKVVVGTNLDNNGFKKGVNNISGSLGGLKSVLGQVGGAIAAAFSVRAVVDFGKQCIELGSNVAEVQNVVDTAFGSMSAKMEAFADTAITNFGMSKLAAKQTGSTFMAMAKGMGLADEAASDMAISLTGLSGDVASFYNLSQDEAANKLKSVFTGETETLKSLGVVMTQTNLKQFAMMHGMNSNIDAMTQAEQVALRYAFVTDALNLASGDFVKTQNSWANQTRILSMQWEEFMSIIGQNLTSTLLPTVQALNNVLALVISTTNAITKFLGIQSEQNTKAAETALTAAENENDLAQGISNAAKAAKKAQAGFDELNVLQSDNSASGTANAVGTSVVQNTTSVSTNNEGQEVAGDTLTAIADFAGKLGGVLAVFGKFKFSGALFAVEGVLDIISGIKDIAENGVNWDNAEQVIGGVAKIGTAIGFAFGNMQLAGISLAISGLTTIITEIGKNWEAIKSGDWSGVDKGDMLIAAIEIIGGILVALDVLSQLKKKTKVTEAAKSVEEVSNEVSNASGKLKTLVKNLGLGIAIIAEVAVAVGLVVAAIWGIGVLLEQVGLAWEPVIENGETVAIAMGIGILLLAGIGTVTALLGKLGGTMCAQIGIGVAVLAELGVAAGLFLAEIWAVGWGLNEIYNAWQPVLDNGETIATAIGIGTGLLVGIGVVTAALGVATVASAGLLPLAIGLGTALLVELAAAFVLFCDSLIDVANKLVDLSEPMDELNAILPGLKTDMDDFTSFMGNFASAVVAFTATSTIAGIAATIDKVISFFTTDPVQRMYEEVNDQTKEFNNLIPALEKINPLIKKATDLIGEYKRNMGSFETATGGSGGFLNAIVGGAKGAVNGLIGLFEGMANGVIKCVNAIIRGLNKISFDVPSWVPSIGGKTFGFDIKPISEISIPRLAQGAVIPPNKEFMAVLGDQKHGTNIEAPLSTIQEAVALVMQDQTAAILSGFEASVGVQREILEAVLGIQIGDDVIGNAVSRYSRKQAIIRGGAL